MELGLTLQEVDLTVKAQVGDRSRLERLKNT
jgi:hypothetical protein